MPRGRRVTRRPPATAAPTWLQQGQIPALAQMYNVGAAQLQRAQQPQNLPPPTYLPTITRGTQATTRAMTRTPAPPVATTPAQPYLPTTLRTRAGEAGGAAGAPWSPPYENLFGWWTEEDKARVTYPGQAGRQYTPPGGTTEAGTAAPAGGGGGGGGRRGAPAPAGVDPGWYDQFQKEHGGQTPEEFYGKSGEGLPHALADKEWAEGFARMYGRPPNEYDWRAHWFSTRAGGTPEERAKRAAQAKPKQEKRPPTYMPPAIIWR